MASEEESPTQIQQRNIREAEMLTSNLGEGGISQQEILSDVSVLKELAILQESMVMITINGLNEVIVIEQHVFFFINAGMVFMSHIRFCE